MRKVADREAEEGFVTWVTLEKAADCIKRLKGADEIVLSANQLSIVVDYPMRHAWVFTLAVPGKRMTRGELALTVAKVYSYIYKEESRTAKIKVGMTKGTYNRNRTDGKFRIYGHVLGDLGLERVILHRATTDSYIARLSVNS